MSLRYCFAQPPQYPAIVALVNAAYRGDESYPGWTHEGHLLEGARISMAQLAAQLAEPQVSMLLAHQDDALCGCMMLSIKGERLYLGTFAVAPHQQGSGIGRSMLQHAERLAAEQWQLSEIEMVVISQRQDLIDYYQRRGYQLDSTIVEFPLELEVGIPRSPGLTLSALRKGLVPSLDGAV